MKTEKKCSPKTSPTKRRSFDGQTAKTQDPRGCDSGRKIEPVLYDDDFQEAEDMIRRIESPEDWLNCREVGTLPASFDPTRIKSQSFFYDPRPGDFIRRADHWEASRMLGPGDLDAVPGFVRTRPTREPSND